MKNSKPSPVKQIINDRICLQLARHRASLGRAMRTVATAIDEIERGRDAIPVTQKAIEATEKLWFHNDVSTPDINNGVLMKCLFDLLAEKE